MVELRGEGGIEGKGSVCRTHFNTFQVYIGLKIENYDNALSW